MNRAGSFLIAAALAAFAATAPAKNLADYQPGDLAETDIVATVPLTITDAAQTELIRAQAAEKLPVIFQHDPTAAQQAEENFLKAFVASRERFLAAFEKTFHVRKLAGEPDADVQDFCNGFPANKKYFPSVAALHLAWARGETGVDYATPLVEKLRAAMQPAIRPNALAAELKTSPRVKLLAPDGAATELPRAAVISLDRARTNLYPQFAPADAAIARFLAGFVRPNCTPDAALTTQARNAQTASLVAAKRFEKGDFILRHGETVTALTKAALVELADRTPAPKPVVKPMVAAAPVATVAPLPASINYRWLWTAGGISVGALILVNLFLISRRRNSNSDLALATNDDWRRRALAAERRAERATAMVRTDLTTQLAKTLTHDLVKKIVEQRDDLLDTQRQAEAEMNALTARLENLDTPAQRQFYEQRIADLEKQLADKSAQNRTLIEEQIKAARQQLAQSKSRMDWN